MHLISPLHSLTKWFGLKQRKQSLTLVLGEKLNRSPWGRCLSLSCLGCGALVALQLWLLMPRSLLRVWKTSLTRTVERCLCWWWTPWTGWILWIAWSAWIPRTLWTWLLGIVSAITEGSSEAKNSGSLTPQWRWGEAKKHWRGSQNWDWAK